MWSYFNCVHSQHFAREWKLLYSKVLSDGENPIKISNDGYNQRPRRSEHNKPVFIVDDEQEIELGVFLQDVDTLETASNVNEAVAGYDARDEARICRFTRLDGTCFKGKNCKLEHVPLSKCKLLAIFDWYAIIIYVISSKLLHPLVSFFNAKINFKQNFI